MFSIRMMYLPIMKTIFELTDQMMEYWTHLQKRYAKFNCESITWYEFGENETTLFWILKLKMVNDLKAHLQYRS